VQAGRWHAGAATHMFSSRRLILISACTASMPSGCGAQTRRMGASRARPGRAAATPAGRERLGAGRGALRSSEGGERRPEQLATRSTTQRPRRRAQALQSPALRQPATEPQLLPPPQLSSMSLSTRLVAALAALATASLCSAARPAFDSGPQRLGAAGDPTRVAFPGAPDVNIDAYAGCAPPPCLLAIQTCSACVWGVNGSPRALTAHTVWHPAHPAHPNSVPPPQLRHG